MRYILPLLLLPTGVFADAATITDARAVQSGDTWRFDVTVAHPDTGWDHYADGWEVRTQDGTVLGTRPLAHPHVNEQPFTRSLNRVDIPADIKTVHIYVRDNLTGYSDTPYVLELP